MQKLLSRACTVYLLFLLFMSGVFVVLLSFGYRYIPLNPIVWLVSNIAVEVIFMQACFIQKIRAPEETTTSPQFLPICALVYTCAAAILVSRLPNAEGVSSYFNIMHVYFCFLSCYVLSLAFVKKRVFPIIYVVFNSLLLVFLLAVFFVVISWGQIGLNTVEKQVTSPKQLHTAILINSDQGALGGDTFVEVVSHKAGIHVGLGKFVKIKRVYSGEWHEFMTMSLEWEDDNTLLINKEPYHIK